jgi:hypothetical protein
MFTKEQKIMQIESRIAKLSTNRVVNQNIINKNLRILRKLKASE